MGESLRCEHMLDFACSDTKGQRTKCTVGCGVAVAAHDGHAGKGASLLGSDDVHDALQRITHREQLDTKLFGVVTHHFNLACRDRVGDGQVNVGRRHVVVFGCNREFRTTNRALRQTQAIESLRACHFMNEVQVDVQKIGFVSGRVHDVAVPNFLGEGGGVAHNFLS